MKRLLGIMTVVVLLLVLVLYATPTNAHFDANDWDHNQAHFDTPIDPQPQTQVAPTVAPTQVVVGDPNQVVTGSANQQMVVTQDGRIVTVDGSTKIVQLRRSFWDSNFWNSVNVVTYPVYGTRYGTRYGGCGGWLTCTRTRYPNNHRHNGGHNGGHNRDRRN